MRSFKLENISPEDFVEVVKAIGNTILVENDEKIKDENGNLKYREFEIDKENQAQINQFAYYITDDPRFSKDLSKALMLMGSVGSGKSILIEITQRAYKDLSLKMFRIESALDIATAYKENIVDKKHVILNTGVLCIDDMGTEPSMVKHFGTDYYPIIEVIHYRYAKKRPTFITTNLSASEIEDHYDGRIRNRLKQMCSTIKFTGPSRRK